jgi:hypothetical protein
MTSGLVISRLGVQATASDDLVHGLLCLRVPHPLLLIREANDRSHYLGRTIRIIQCDGTSFKVSNSIILPIAASLRFEMDNADE